MENEKKHFTWYGSASSEAGPFIISAVEDFAQWKGSDDTLPVGFRVRYYGPLLKELSPKFHIGEPVRFENEDRFNAFIQMLFNEINTVKPQISMQHKQGDYDFFLEDTNVFHLETGPDTDYTRICETAIDKDEIAIASFGTNAWALFWDVRPNTVRLALEQTRRDVFFITGLSDENREKALELVLAGEKFYEVGELSLPTGCGVLAWSPMTQGDFGAPDGLSQVADLNPPIHLNSLNILKVGTVFKVQPGTYNVTCGWSKVEENNFAWVRMGLQV